MSDQQDVILFVCCEAHNGPFDDRAFMAGFQIGQLYEQLHFERPSALSVSVFWELEQMVDLIAMSAGYACAFRRGFRTEDGWIEAFLQRIDNPAL